MLLWAWPALASVYTSPNGTQVEWISESQTLRPGQTHWTGLLITPAQGWHTYWRNPGAAGASVQFNVEPTSQAILGGLRWPAPERKVFEGLNVYGYERDVLLAMPTVLLSGAPVTLTASATWLVCKELCIPESAELSLTLTPGDGAFGPWAQRFGEARARWPAEDPLIGQWDSTGRAQVTLPPGVAAGEWAFFPYDNEIWPADQYQQSRGFNDRVQFQVAANQSPAAGELVNIQSGQAWRVEWQLASVAATSVAMWMALGAFGGGLLLNLMPCVFPVLSIKALGVAQLSGSERQHRRRKGHFFALGVLASFAVLGLVLLGLQQAGAAVGWGFQLQSPVFVLAMAALMLVLSASLLGWFKLGGALMGAGQSLTQRSGYSGDFYTGVLAVLVASPCTAPFMGPALGFALASPALVMFAILLALAVGFALPMWLVFQSSAIAARLPAPGAWMQTFQQLLAFPMLGTALWLLWVGLRQLGFDLPLSGFLIPLVVALAVFVGWRMARPWGVIAAAVLMLSAVYWTWPRPPVGVQWQDFSAQRLQQARQDQQLTLVNVTADWCISCLSNERLVFASREMGERSDVLWLKADWTDYDPEITAYLDSFGRAGVPLYVLYRGNNSQVLPQLLTIEAVTALLDER